ncbi:YcxB family protein [Actinoplanes sp. NPDC049548]|uniref:YcxB family protein n=1 Tax=Actinoplanes sp. NPDC049548 TaxID=3155152 RepID=UPI0034204C79
MLIEFTFSRDRDYFRPNLTPGARLRTRPLLIGGWYAVTAGAALVAFLPGRPAAVLLGCVGVLGGIGLLVLRSRRIRAFVTVPASWLSPRRWLVTEGGVASSTHLTRARYAWSAFRTGVALPHCYLLVQDGNVIVDIPRRPLSADQDAELGRFLVVRGILGRRAGR